MKRLRKHWHHILAIAGLLLASFGLGVGTTAAVYHHLEKAGYRPGPLPPRIRISGVQTPRKVYLGRWIVRIHNQGNSESCVGQTISTIEEIVHNERTNERLPFSSGFIWNQLNGGVDQGITYEAAFDLLDNQGDAVLSAFPADGFSDFFQQPGPQALQNALHYKAIGWRSIDPGDAETMRAELASGNPLAVAIPVTDSYYNLWNLDYKPTIRHQAGSFHFWHSMTAIGYGPKGITVLNSWGPSYAWHGRVQLSWGFLLEAGAAITVAHFPATPVKPVVKKPTVVVKTSVRPFATPTATDLPWKPATPHV